MNTWIRIRIPNTDPDPESVAQRIRIQYGSGYGSATLPLGCIYSTLPWIYTSLLHTHIPATTATGLFSDPYQNMLHSAKTIVRYLTSCSKSLQLSAPPSNCLAGRAASLRNISSPLSSRFCCSSQHFFIVRKSAGRMVLTQASSCSSSGLSSTGQI